MNVLTASVVIPAYNGARFLGEAIQSVLGQTYPNIELIVVDDVSTDNTAGIVRQFDDSRIKYILHDKNKGAIAARYTGSRASKGDFIAFLDQDDLFHPAKIETHANFFSKHPEIGLTYNPRYDLNHSSNTIRDIFKPPKRVNLADLVLGFPIAPSDMVLRREWAVREDIWDDTFISQSEETIVNGGEYIFLGRLYFAGCKFANVERVLNYRRHQSGRTFSKLSVRCRSEITCQDHILLDPRCPREVLALRNLAHMNTNIVFACYAFLQEETELGQQLIRDAVRLNPSIMYGKPAKFMQLLLSICIDDENINHEERLKRILKQLPFEFRQLSEQYDWAVTTGYLLRGSRAIIWGRPEEGCAQFDRAVELHARINSYYRENVAAQLLSYEAEYGINAAQDILYNLVSHLKKMGDQENLHRLLGLYWLGQAFQNYYKGNYESVPQTVLKAINNDLKHLGNRGALAITIRSLLRKRV
jgi:glycosyltransferase involved in cell wall biosynthesis